MMNFCKIYIINNTFVLVIISYNDNKINLLLTYSDEFVFIKLKINVTLNF